MIRSRQVKSNDVGMLMRLFTDPEEDIRVRDVAGEALYWQNARWKPWHRRTVELEAAFVAGLSHPAPELRNCCIHAVARAGNFAVLPQLLWMVENDRGFLPGGHISIKKEAGFAIEIITQ